MKVDIIIPAYHGIYLAETIQSCLAQSHKDFNIIVVDNNSPVDIKSICQKFPRINYIKSERNLGPAGGRNLGIKNSSAPLISFIDDDDIMHKDKLFYSVKEFEKPTVGMTCGNYQILLNRGRLLQPFYKSSPIINWATLMKQNLVASGSVTIRRDILNQVGLFNEKLWIAEDYDMWLKCAQSYEIKYIPKVLYYYSIIKGGQSLTQREDIQKLHLKNLEEIKKESRDWMITHGKLIQ